MLRRLEIVKVLSPILVIAGCAGGGGGTDPIGQTNLPVLPLAPAVTATAPTPLVAPVQTSGPSPSASNDGTTKFPLLITAVTHDFSGDADTTRQGATVAMNASGQRTLTVNNPAFGATDVPIGQLNPLVMLPAGSIIVVRGHYDYTEYGSWQIHAARGAGNAVYVGGYETPAAQVPASGTAIYSGTTTGLYTRIDACPCYEQFVGGNVQLTADFGARTVSGSLTNLYADDGDNWMPTPLNDVGFTAAIDSAENRFTGTTRVTSEPGGFSPNATGVIAGRFFGPAAQSVGAVWTLSDSTRRLIASFGARQ
jgi:hypothetical protein